MTQDTQAGAGEQPAPAQLPMTLRQLAEIVHDWGKRDHAWAHPDPDCFDVALFGHVSEDGERYPLAEVNADTYGHEGVSLQLAQFYAAASPAAVLALLDRVELRDNELNAALADAKHWRSNHDNVVARLRIFTQRPDIIKELADRLPWYRELVRLQEVEAQALPSVVLGPLAERGILDAIRSAYDLGYNDARSARAVPGDSAPGYKGRQVEGDHGGALVHQLNKLQAAPPAPAAVAVPAEILDALGMTGGEVDDVVVRIQDMSAERHDAEEARDEIAAAPAPAQAVAWMTAEGDRVVTEATMAGARRDGGAMLSSLRPFTVALGRIAAPAQAMAAPDHRAAFEMAYAFAWHKHRQGQEKVEELAAEIVSWREGNTYGEDLPRLRFGWEGYQWALATAPAQEHATQLAGQALPADEFRGDTASLVRNIVALLDLDAQGCLVPHGVGGHARGLLSAAASRLAAAPVQAQEDAAVLEAPAAPAGLDDSELEDLAHSANQECLSFGMSLDPFLRLAKTVRDRALAAAPQAPAAPAVDARGERDAAFEAVRNRLCGLQRYSFVLDDDGVVRRAQDRSGNWIEFDEAHELFDPVAVDAAIDAARAAQRGDKP